MVKTKSLHHFHVDAAIKGSPAIHDRVVFIGTYGGRLYAFQLRDGRELWSTQTRRDFSFGGELYSSPSVACCHKV